MVGKFMLISVNILTCNMFCSFLCIFSHFVNRRIVFIIEILVPCVYLLEIIRDGCSGYFKRVLWFPRFSCTVLKIIFQKAFGESRREILPHIRVRFTAKVQFLLLVDLLLTLRYI